MEKSKYAKCNISYCSDPYSDCDIPVKVVLIFSESELKDIQKHMKYTAANDVIIRSLVKTEYYFFEEEEGPMPVVEDSFGGFIPTNEYIYIYPEGFYYKGYSEDGQVYLESEYFEFNNLKPVTEWPEEI